MRGRPTGEIALTEISSTRSEIAHQLNHLVCSSLTIYICFVAYLHIECVVSFVLIETTGLQSEYMAEKKIPSTAAFLTDSGYLHYTPLGNVLIIAPWNFPCHLTFAPLAGAIAAGCTAIIKPYVFEFE